MKLMNILLMAGGQGTGQTTGGSAVSTIIMMVLIIVVFYLFFIRPQSKKNKELKKFREGLKRGDKVITAGGIHGKILEVQDNTVIIETEGLGKLKVEKASIASSIAGNGDSSNA